MTSKRYSPHCCGHKRLAKSVCYGDIIVECLDCKAFTQCQNDEFKDDELLRRHLNAEIHRLAGRYQIRKLQTKGRQ